jgi:hypothetical protein
MAKQIFKINYEKKNTAELHVAADTAEEAEEYWREILRSADDWKYLDDGEEDTTVTIVNNPDLNKIEVDNIEDYEPLAKPTKKNK